MADAAQIAAEIAANEAEAQVAATAAQTAVAAAQTAIVMADAQTAQVVAHAAEEINDAQRDMARVTEDVSWLKEKTNSLQVQMETGHLAAMEKMSALEAAILALAPVRVASESPGSQSSNLEAVSPQSAGADGLASPTPAPTQAPESPTSEPSAPQVKSKKYRRL